MWTGRNKGEIEWQGTLYANKFVGDGSGLTGVAGSGNVATDAIWDVKGDLAVGTGADTAIRLAVGTDTYVLTADSTEPSGIKWAAGGGGAVDSVFGRTGDVVATTNDYTWAQIDKTTSDIANITTKSHTSLSDIGTNTHAQIDTHIASSAIHYVNPGFLTAETDPIFNAASAAYNTHLASSAIHFTSNALWASLSLLDTEYQATSAAYIAHAADTSDPHGATLTQTTLWGTTVTGTTKVSSALLTSTNITSSGTSSFAALVRTGDFSTVSTAYISNTVIGTDATPPTASNFPIGTVYFQYTP